MIAREIQSGRSVRTCWTRLSLGSAGEGHQTRGELEDTTWAALLSQKPGCAREGHSEQYLAATLQEPLGRAAALFGSQEKKMTPPGPGQKISPS